eukprot:30865-Pelagococcus_subviridis.AAC.8
MRNATQLSLKNVVFVVGKKVARGVGCRERHHVASVAQTAALEGERARVVVVAVNRRPVASPAAAPP